MTTPYERTQAVLRTRELLKELTSGECLEPDALRRRAESLPRHFPAPTDVDLSAAVLPGIWAALGTKWYQGGA